MINGPVMLRVVALVVAAVSLTVALAQPSNPKVQQYPDIQAVSVRASGTNLFDFDVTISSPYDTAQRYADGFRAVGKDGRVFGERILLHDHADEQPFTRDLYAVTIPGEVRTILIQARDRQYGYGGKAVEVNLPGR